MARKAKYIEDVVILLHFRGGSEWFKKKRGDISRCHSLPHLLTFKPSTKAAAAAQKW